MLTAPTGTTPDADASIATKAAVQALAQWLPGWIDLRRRMLRVPGVQISVRVAGELLVSAALGHADEERGVPLTTDHLFRIASHSKTFASTACMILTERGVIRLDDTVAQWVPELADTELAGLTVRALLGHQAGVIRDGQDSDYWQLIRAFPDQTGLVEALRHNGSTFATDLHFKYSNYGYSVIGLIVERASGVGFNEFVRHAIMDKLDLPRVHPDVDGIDPDELAVGHSLRLDALDEQFTLSNPSTGAMSAATGFVACADDLTAYASAHLPGDDRLVSDAGKRLMQRTESIVEVRGVEKGRYGLGLELHTLGQRKTFGHSGGFPGFITRTFVDPADQLVVSVLTNQSGGPAHELAVGVLAMIDLAVTAQQAGSEWPAIPDGLDGTRFGTRLAAGFGYLDVVDVGGRLALLHPGMADPASDAAYLQVLDADTLSVVPSAGYALAGETVKFERSADGSIASAVVGGMRSWPVETFLARRRAQMGRAAQDRVQPAAEETPDGH
ncbi:CubicO group peptidase, beta-lactamase class C family [Nakamurella panacisegetis]|uniref:CubicO group peptidase, beta-lactamase class C family n=1 Tax=Nakamurella panacisegetis TaxID=1090615 RepID=A0A1H0S659_9ACTN|nr:serine hydrolase domain-containing protein [Nakamurella panacisegetis]SDP37204.1 CubicO group peptidase, beta-lactamase class C family [Nakamurella panacisegetis]